MKKSKKIILNLIFWIAIFIVCFASIMKDGITNLDELWNFNTARAIMKGLVPYKEISMITTPFLPFVVSIFLKIFGDEIIVFRILTGIVLSTIFFLCYVISYKLTEKRGVGLITSLALIYLCRYTYALDYNYFVLMLTLIVILLEIKKKESSKEVSLKENSKESAKKDKTTKNTNQEKFSSIKYDIIIGIILGLAICTKQTIGVFVAFFTILSELIYVHDKVSFKKYIKASLIKIISLISVFAIFIIYLLATNSFKDFIDYAILGIRTFSNSIPYTRLFENDNRIIGFLAKILPVCISILLIGTICLFVYLLRNNNKIKNNICSNKANQDNIKKEESEEKNKILDFIRTNLLVLQEFAMCFVISLGMVIVIYPISDEIHFLIGTIALQTILISLIAELLMEISKHGEVQIKSKKINITNLMLFILEIFLIMTFIYKIFTMTYKNIAEYKNAEKTISLPHYSYMPEEGKAEMYVKSIINYVDSKRLEGYNVYIVDSDAVLYSIPMDTYTKNYDMFLKGNIGKDGEDGIIENIKNSDNTLYLVKKERYKLNWQTPMKVINYIRENLKIVDEIGTYNVYQK